MAKVTFMDAILSGKRGGSVFSRNRAGAYVRQWVRPINPNTIAQQNARTNFGLSSNQYHSLSDPAKALWNAFSAFYNPKGVTLPSSLSGFNVFIAMNNTAKNAHDNEWTYDVKKNGAGSPLAKTNNSFVQSSVAPSSQLISTYTYDAGIAPLLILPGDVNIVYNASGSFTFSIDLQANPSVTSGTGVTNPLTDTNGQQYGFAFYMSKGVQQAHNFKANPEMQLLGSITNFELASAPTTITTYNISGSASINPTNYQTTPNAGEIVQITMYQVGINGMFNKLLAFNTAVNP